MARSTARLLMAFLMAGSLNGNGLAAQDQEKQFKLPPSIPKIENAPDASITKTLRQLEEITRIHQTLRLQQQTQILEIQRITEQARMHQRILNELKTPAGIGGTPTEATSMEEVLRVQKITLIQEQARKNRLRLKRLQRKAAREKKSEETLLSEAAMEPTKKDQEEEAPTPPAKKNPFEDLFKAFSTQKLPFGSQKQKEK